MSDFAITFSIFNDTKMVSLDPKLVSDYENGYGRLKKEIVEDMARDGGCTELSSDDDILKAVTYEINCVLEAVSVYPELIRKARESGEL